MSQEEDRWLTTLTVELNWEFVDASVEGCEEQFLDMLKEVCSTRNFDSLTFSYKQNEIKPKKKRL